MLSETDVLLKCIVCMVCLIPAGVVTCHNAGGNTADCCLFVQPLCAYHNGFALQASLDLRLLALLVTVAGGAGHSEDTDRKVGDSSSNMQDNDEQESMA